MNYQLFIWKQLYHTTKLSTETWVVCDWSAHWSSHCPTSLRSQYSRGEEGYSIRRFYDHLARKFGMVPHGSKYKETMVKATQPDYQESAWERWRISWNEILKCKARNAAKEELAECAKRYHQCLDRLLKEANDRVDERNHFENLCVARCRHDWGLRTSLAK